MLYRMTHEVPICNHRHSWNCKIEYTLVVSDLILFQLLAMFYFLRVPESVFLIVRFTLSCQKIHFVQLGACDFSDKDSKRGLFSLLLAIWYLHLPMITNLYSLTFPPFCLFLFSVSLNLPYFLPFFTCYLK